jgi:hypothetical protein
VVPRPRSDKYRSSVFQRIKDDIGMGKMSSGYGVRKVHLKGTGDQRFSSRGLCGGRLKNLDAM